MLVIVMAILMQNDGFVDSYGAGAARCLWMELGLEYVSIIVQHDRKTIILVMFLMMVN